MQYFRRIPKRGFTNADFKTVYHIVNLASLEARFEKGATVDATALVEAGLIRNFKNPVKNSRPRRSYNRIEYCSG